MEMVDVFDIISTVIAAKGKAAVYVCNHELDNNILPEFIREINKRYGPEVCRDLIDETFEEGLVFFDSAKESKDFYSIWENEVIFKSGLLAVLYDSAGNRVSASCNGCEYE